MKDKICPYCGHPFRPCRFHPEQRVCSGTKCQQQRRAEYHRKRLAEDPVYRDDCARSRAKWQERNPGYAKERRTKLRGEKQETLENTVLGEFQQLINLLREDLGKKNSALSATRCSADVWLIGRGDPERVRKYAAPMQLIVIS